MDLNELWHKIYEKISQNTTIEKVFEGIKIYDNLDENVSLEDYEISNLKQILIEKGYPATDIKYGFGMFYVKKNH